MMLHEISIEIIHKCPNNCIHCSSYSSWDKETMMPIELIQNVIRDAVELGAKTICLSGGEPFLHPQIVDIVNSIVALGANCIIYTSGIYFDGIAYQSIPNVLLKRIKVGVDKLIINYEASDAATYDTIMGTHVDGYTLMRQTISNAFKEGIIVETHVVPMKINLLQIPAIITQCEELGVSRISFLRMVKHGRVLENKEMTCLTDEEMNQAKVMIRTIIKDKAISIRFGIPFSDCMRRKSCMTGTSKLNIRYDGLVYPCEAFKNDLPEDFVAIRPESVYMKSLKDIYTQSAYLAEIRKRLQEYQMIDTDENCMNQYYTKKKESGNDI